MDAGVLSALTAMGLPGIVIAALAYVAWQKSKQVDALHDTRVRENRETMEALSHNTQALNRMSDLIDDRVQRGRH